MRLECQGKIQGKFRSNLKFVDADLLTYPKIPLCVNLEPSVQIFHETGWPENQGKSKVGYENTFDFFLCQNPIKIRQKSTKSHRIPPLFPTFLDPTNALLGADSHLCADYEENFQISGFRWFLSLQFFYANLHISEAAFIREGVQISHESGWPENQGKIQGRFLSLYRFGGEPSYSKQVNGNMLHLCYTQRI